MKTTKLKPLIKSFSFNEMQDECKIQGWRLPTLEEVRGSDLEHNVIWISDLPDDEADKETHALIYNAEKDVVELANKMFRFNICVVVKPKTCLSCEWSDEGYCMCGESPIFELDLSHFPDWGCSSHEFI